MTKTESFEEVKNESFYASPPFTYRPSLAEYLSTMEVTRSGFVADILHLDYKKAIKIKSMKESIIELELLNQEDLNSSELVIWRFFESVKKNEKVIVDVRHIPATVMTDFEDAVMTHAVEKFNKKHPRTPEDIYEQQKKWAGHSSRDKGQTVASFLFLTFCLGAIPLFFLGLLKVVLKKESSFSTIKLFFPKLLYKTVPYIVASILTLFLMFWFVETAMNEVYRITGAAVFVIIFFMIMFVLPIVVWSFTFIKFTPISRAYVNWIAESKESAEHREKWIAFREFVQQHSAIQDRPLMHYQLWGPFYYYTLAIGGVRKIS